MYDEIMKIFGDFKAPAFDFNSLFDVQRRNAEAFAAANKVATTNAQNIATRQTEIARDNVENFMNASKEMFSGKGTPEVTLEKQAALTKSLVEKSMSNAREVSEMISKSNFEAFDLLNKRATQNFEEISKVATESK